MRMRTSSGLIARRRGILALVIVMLTSLFIWPPTASAHGTIVSPATRAYHCWEVWGSNHTNPAMQQQDPMCWQAFQANPDTMNFQGLTPDGTLCSNNLSRNNSLNTPGQWKTTNVGSNFSMHLYDQASHGADFLRVYVSKNGFDPATQRLGWGNLDFITQTGRYAPAKDITFDVQTSGYSGHHVVFTIWQASHLDQAYMWCSDVNFG
jgi:predicted carbohydrate-binding protein with CBM5 and CBM33 domain